MLSLICLCGLHKQIWDDTLRTCIKPPFHRARTKCIGEMSAQSNYMARCHMCWILFQLSTFLQHCSLSDVERMLHSLSDLRNSSSDSRTTLESMASNTVFLNTIVVNMSWNILIIVVMNLSVDLRCGKTGLNAFGYNSK